MNKQISRGFKAYLGDKKILKVLLEIRPGTPPTPMKQRKTGTFVFNGRRDRTCCRIPKQISGGFSSCLGRKKMFLQFWETRLGRPPTFNPKVVRKKIAFSRLHRKPENRPCAQTLLFKFCKKLVPYCLKQVVGQHISAVMAESYVGKTKMLNTYEQDCRS